MNIVLDLGANIECDDKNLVEFSEMGAALHKSLFPKENTKVALLNVGSEEIKGTEIIKKAYYKLNLRKKSLTMKRGFGHKIKLAYKKYLIKGIKEKKNKISRHFAERLILNKNFEEWKKLNNSKKSYYEYLGDVYGE